MPGAVASRGKTVPGPTATSRSLPPGMTIPRMEH